MDKYQLSNTAELDVDHLYVDGILKYGLRQADQYYDGLIEQLLFLAENSNIGYFSGELAPNLQRFPYGRHIIFFMNTRRLNLRFRFGRGYDDTMLLLMRIAIPPI